MPEKSIEPNNSNEDIRRALKVVATEGNKLLEGDPDAREKLVASARELIAATESPVDTLLWNIWTRVSLNLVYMFGKLMSTPTANP